jgi:hypothetical protein
MLKSMIVSVVIPIFPKNATNNLDRIVHLIVRLEFEKLLYAIFLL